LPIPCKCLKELAGTTGLEPAASAVTGQRSNQLNYVPNCKIGVAEKEARELMRLARFNCPICCRAIGIASSNRRKSSSQKYPTSFPQNTKGYEPAKRAPSNANSPENEHRKDSWAAVCFFPPRIAPATAKQRKNAAHGKPVGGTAETEQAPTGRKRGGIRRIRPSPVGTAARPRGVF
jgi:hypothetical protein